MHEAKQNGAAGIFFSGIVGSLTLNNPHFMPIYAEAEKLGLPICVHTGQSCRHLLDFFDLELNGTFATSHLPPSSVPRPGRQRDPGKFPDLKFGFLEVRPPAGCRFCTIISNAPRRPRPSSDARWKHASCKALFRDYRFYVACEADEIFPTWRNSSAKITCSSAPTTATTTRRKKKRWCRR